MKPSVCWSVLNKSSQFLFYRMCMYVSVHKRRFSECVRDFDFKLWHQYLPSFQKESLSQYLWSWWNTKSKRSLQTTHFKPDQSITGKQIVFFPLSISFCIWLNVWLNISLSLYQGPMFVLPFVLMMFVELSLSFLSLFDGAWILPGTPKYRDVLQAVVRITQLILTSWKLHAYLDWKSVFCWISPN